MNCTRGRLSDHQNMLRELILAYERARERLQQVHIPDDGEYNCFQLDVLRFYWCISIMSEPRIFAGCDGVCPACGCAAAQLPEMHKTEKGMLFCGFTQLLSPLPEHWGEKVVYINGSFPMVERGV